MPEDKPVLRCDNILVSSRGVAETAGKKVVIFVPTNDIERISVNFGRSDHRPIITISIGAIFALVGVFGLIEFFVATRGYRYELGMVAFGLIGASLIFDALKKRYFLEVHKKKGTTRLVLSKHTQKTDIQDFCEKVRTIYKYDITDAA
jgi:hypothetical protein